MGIGSGTNREENAVPGWVDVTAALWIVIAGAAFIMKVLLDAGIASQASEPIITISKITYAALIVGCAVGGSLALMRWLRRS